MNAALSIDLSRYFYNSKRERFLNDTFERMRAIKWGFSGADKKDVEAYRQLSDNDKKEYRRKILLAADLRNEIIAQRKKQMQQDGIFDLMNGIEKTINHHL